MRCRLRAIVLLGLLFVMMIGGVTAQDDIVIDFYFPSATANDAEGSFQRYADAFQEQNPGITVNPVFTGSYTDTRNTILTELQGGGAGPDVAVMLSIDLYSFAEEGYIVPAQTFIDGMEDGEAYVSDFFPALMLNGVDAEGNVWSLPFQRSTPILYYNADLLAGAGYDSPPTNNAKLVEIAQALTTVYIAANATARDTEPLASLAQEIRPLTVGLNKLIKTTDQGAFYGQLMAGTLIVIAPLVILFLLFQRQFVESFARSGIR